VVLISLSKHKRKDFQVIIAFGHSAFITSQLLFVSMNMVLKRYLEILGVCQRRLHMLCRPRKHTIGFLVKKFVECCGSIVLTPTCYWPSCHCVPYQKFVSVSGELNNDRSLSLLVDSDKGVFCHYSFS